MTDSETASNRRMSPVLDAEDEDAELIVEEELFAEAEGEGEEFMEVEEEGAELENGVVGEGSGEG